MKSGLVVLALALILVVCAHGAFAAQPLGGPVEAEKGKWAFSAGYFYSQDRYKSSTISGDFDPKVSTYTYFGQLAYGVAQGWDIYVRSGVVDAKLAQSDVDFSANGKFFAAVGTHGTLFEKKDWHLQLGPIANVAYYSNWTDRRTGPLVGTTGTGLTSITLKEHWSANVGIGFRWSPSEFFTLYGGPFWNYETAKLQSNGYIRRTAFSGSGNNIEGDKSIGSRLGVRIPFKNEWSLNFEAQMKDYFGAGGWLTLNF